MNNPELSERVAGTIERYDMFDKELPVPVAFSGGKDSATTIFILAGLGYDVRPVVADRGDDILFNAPEIAGHMKDRGYGVEILNLRECAYLDRIDPEYAEEISGHLKRFDGIRNGESHCTSCYNARTTGFQDFTRRLGSDVFVLGQHKNDMITSLMKCYWTEKYYNALTKPLGISYDGSLMGEFIIENDIDLEYLNMMVKNGRAATDDPPVEMMGDGIRMVRPLCDISESEIVESIGDYPHTSTNCMYRETDPRPFRLIVQFDLDKRLEDEPGLEDALYRLVLKGLNEDGTLRARPRNKRNEYYPGFKPYIRKL